MRNDLKDDLLPGVRKIAEYLGESNRAVYHMSDKGLIPTFKIGGKIYARKTELERAFSSQRTIVSSTAAENAS